MFCSKRWQLFDRELRNRPFEFDSFLLFVTTKAFDLLSQVLYWRQTEPLLLILVRNLYSYSIHNGLHLTNGLNGLSSTRSQNNKRLHL